MQTLFIKIVVFLALGLVSCQGSDRGHAEIADEQTPKGPHGGRMLVEGNFQTEVTIFERGIPPEFRIYCFDNGQQIDPNNVRMTIELSRLGGRTDVIEFDLREDYLVGDQVVEEPHSFDVAVLAEYQGQVHRWEYESYEGRTEITDEMAQSSGIVIETVGPANIKQIIRVFGRIVPNEDRLVEIEPRFPGLVKEVFKRLGETVTKNDVLAIVESNESLQKYSVKSSIDGTIVRKNVTPGKVATEGEPIYTVADLSQVWVDLHVYPRDFAKLRIGQVVAVSAGDNTTVVQGKVSYISPFGAQDTQTMLARVELPNPGGQWRPGLFAVGEIVVDDVIVPLAVRTGAVQTFRDWDVVFRRDGNLFEIAILELGRRDHDWVEVLSGLALGLEYAAENSFIVKADIGKSGATHDH